MEPSIALLGFGVGVLVGLTGMGGAALMTPLLILLVGMRPLVAVGTDLAYSTVTKLVGGWQHARQNNVDLPIALFLALGSVPGGRLGVGLLGVVQGLYGEGIDAFVRRMLGIVLLVVALVVLVRPLFFRGSGRVPQQVLQVTSRRKVLTTLLGAVVGFLVGITSVGSGTLIIAGLTLFYGCLSAALWAPTCSMLLFSSAPLPWPTWGWAAWTCIWF